MGLIAQGLRHSIVAVVALIPSCDKLTLFITHNIQPLRVAVVVVLSAKVKDWIHGDRCGVGQGSFVPVASNLTPTRPNGKKSPIFLNILNKEALMRKIQILYKI